MQYLSADCIVPVSGEPLYNSVLAVTDEGRIEGLFAKRELEDKLTEIQHYNGILCPGFVNTHCHLELSWAKGLISPGEGLDNFILQLETLRKTVSPNDILHAIETEASAMALSGVVATADIANGNQTLEYKSNSKEYFHTYVEMFGSNPLLAYSIFKKAVTLYNQFKAQLSSGSVSMVPHATYSLSDELFILISAAGKGKPMSIHHQENADENLFFANGSGRIAERRRTFNPDLPAYNGTGKRPMESIARFFDTGQKLLLVHNTVSEQQDIDFVQHYFNQLYWCLCPNANVYIENKLPDINLFRGNKCKITLGTDSLASNRQLSILEEMKTIQLHYPDIPLTELIKWGTLNGAEFLSCEQKLGTFEKGKKPGVVHISNMDINTMKLTTRSTSRLIIPAGI
jgi:cytosine/adenosine deaminase-related metal-dependent hydrolase